jgi:membrane protein required for colicin V production
MQTYDFIMLAVLAAATIFGFWKGLAWQIASIASIVASYFLALKFADRVAPMISKNEPSNKFLAMLVIYAGASLAIWMIYRAVGGAIDRVKLNEFDRQMGALVGFAKGVLFCIAITFFAVTILGKAQRDQIIASRSGQYIVQVLDKADAVAPPEIKEVIGPYIRKVNERLDPNYQPSPDGGSPDLQNLWRQAQAAAEAAGVVPGGGATNGGSGNNGGGAVPAWPTPPATSSQTPVWPDANTGQRL